MSWAIEQKRFGRWVKLNGRWPTLDAARTFAAERGLKPHTIRFWETV